MITIKTFAFNLLQENTYVVSDETLDGGLVRLRPLLSAAR
jgi:hypothetical protein